MKKYFNLYYLAIIGIGALLWHLNGNMGKEVVSFYGYAENKETEINFNYPVAVGAIHVRPGELVKHNEPLLDLYRIKAKEVMEDGAFKIAELKAKETIWQTDKDSDLKRLRLKNKLDIERIDTDIQKLKEQQAFDKSLYDDLKSVSASTKKTTYSPTAAKIEALERERALLQRSYTEQVKAIQQELAVGKNPYRIAIDRLKAEAQFEEETKKQHIEIKAPSDGVIGNIHCKEAEHISSFKTLITFYEPNPTLIKGFVQEDLLLHVALKDSFIIRSTKDPAIFCYGEVTGLGSRIVEIPERLRKIAGLKTYGREILVSIPANNQFLQREKVILEFVNPNKELVAKSKLVKPLVDLKKEGLNER